MTSNDVLARFPTAVAASADVRPGDGYVALTVDVVRSDSVLHLHCSCMSGAEDAEAVLRRLEQLEAVVGGGMNAWWNEHELGWMTDDGRRVITKHPVAASKLAAEFALLALAGTR